MTVLLELFWSFFQIGLFSIGGGYAAMPLIQHQVVDLHGWMTMQEFIDIITIFFGETSSGYYLQTVCIRIIRITSQHLIKTVLLQSVIGATIGKECGHFFARHGTGKSNPMDQRKTRDCFFHCFQLDILPLCMSRKLNH